MNNSIEYDYDEILNITKTGGRMDNHLVDFGAKLVDIEKTTNELQELFHGKGSTSSLYKMYKNIYFLLGQNNGNGEYTGTATWGIVGNASDLQNKMYSRAAYDKACDEEEALEHKLKI